MLIPTPSVDSFRWQERRRVHVFGHQGASCVSKGFPPQPNEAVRRMRLAEELGGTSGEVQERAVDVQITRLRRKIERDPKNPRYLQTVRGAGYMLTPD